MAQLPVYMRMIAGGEVAVPTRTFPAVGGQRGLGRGRSGERPRVVVAPD